MKVITASEIEQQKLIDFLEIGSIPYRLEKKGDDVLPSINPSRHFEFDIDDRYAALLSEVIGELPSAIVLSSPPAQSSRKRFASRLIWTYAIIISLLFLRYWYLTAPHYKNFDIAWNASGTVLTMTDKRTGKVASRSWDRNYNFNEEEYLVYVNGQGPVIAYFDNNEDGYFEETFYYDLEGNLTGIYEDLDFDKLNDRAWFILENGDTIRLEDRNKNTIWELVR